ncbi:MAG: flagellin FliC [Nitrosomonadales bacterium]|nr:MAG: flagellin FliC [Nitrosomonadales bacterium]
MINTVSVSGLSSAQDAQSTTLKRLSSGSRINSAKDDAAGLAVAVALASQLGGTSQAIRNISDGLSLTDTAAGAAGQVTDTLQRMRELTVQAANGTNSASDLQNIQGEINQLGQSINQIAGNTEFNGQKLLDGSFGGQQLQTGPNPGNTQTVALGNVSSQALGIANLDVTSQANAASALNSLDNAINSVNALQTSIGATQAGLTSSLANLSNTYENLAAARSRINDTDYAKESANLARNNVQTQSATRALSVYNATQSNVLNLINKV